MNKSTRRNSPRKLHRQRKVTISCISRTNSSRGKMQEMYDDASSLDKGREQDGGEDKKERNFGEKIPACFAPKIVAADIQKRRRRCAGRAAMVPVQRKRLIIDRKSTRLNSSHIPLSRM